MLVLSDPVHAFVDYPDVPVANAEAGPLEGLSFAVKDIFDVAGYPTGCGVPEKRAESGPAAAHAPVVATLLAAGARFVGKTHTAELAYSVDGRNARDGTPINPAAPGRVPGGSSSGSAAAVAAGLVDFALGSDTGGSVRGPASFCGIIGLRPTFGRIDIGGTMPLAVSFDTVGWFAQEIDVFARVGALLLGEDVDGGPLRRAVIGEDAFAQLGEAERAALRPAMARVAAVLDEDGRVMVAPNGLDAFQRLYRTLMGFEAWRAHGAWIERAKPKLSPPVSGRFEAASRVSREQYEAAKATRIGIRKRVAEIVGSDSVVVMPTMPCIAPLLEASDASLETFRSTALGLTSIASLSGLPQISLPLATVDGCPLGLSLMGPPGRDRALIDVARSIIGG